MSSAGDSCLSFNELVQLSEEALPASGHLLGCLRCTALLRALGGAFEADEVSAGPATAVNGPEIDPDSLGPGQVVVTVDPRSGAGRLALVSELCDQDQVAVFPLCEVVHTATAADAFLPDELLGYRCVAMTDSESRVLKERVREVLADGGRELAGALKSMADGHQPTGFVTGAPVTTDADRRPAWREEHQLEEFHFLNQEARHLGSRTLGEMLAARRASLRLAQHDLAEQAELRVDAVAALEKGHLPRAVRLQPARLGQLLRQLGLVSSQRLTELVEQAARATFRELPAGPGFATASVSARVGEYDSAPDELARQFTEEVLHSMEEPG